VISRYPTRGTGRKKRPQSARTMREPPLHPLRARSCPGCRGRERQAVRPRERRCSSLLDMFPKGKINRPKRHPMRLRAEAADSSAPKNRGPENRGEGEKGSENGDNRRSSDRMNCLTRPQASPLSSGRPISLKPPVFTGRNHGKREAQPPSHPTRRTPPRGSIEPGRRGSGPRYLHE